MTAKVEVRGLDDAMASLRELGKAAEPKRVREALMAGGKIMADAWRSRMRRKSGKTAAAISAEPARRAFGDTLDVTDAVVVSANYRGYIARFLEHGYLRRNKRTGTVSHIAAYPSAAAAFDASEEEAARAVEAVLTQGVGE